MAESESAAVPLGDTPILSNSLYGMAGVPGLEPGKWRDQNPLPYHLAIPLNRYFRLCSTTETHYKDKLKIVNN